MSAGDKGRELPQMGRQLGTLVARRKYYGTSSVWGLFYFIIFFLRFLVFVLSVLSVKNFVSVCVCLSLSLLFLCLCLFLFLCRRREGEERKKRKEGEGYIYIIIRPLMDAIKICLLQSFVKSIYSFATQACQWFGDDASHGPYG